MRFIWEPLNTAHVLRHEPLEIAEAVVRASSRSDLTLSPDGLTYSGITTYAGERYLIAYMFTKYQDEAQVYILNCYKKRRGGAKRRSP